MFQNFSIAVLLFAVFLVSTKREWHFQIRPKESSSNNNNNLIRMAEQDKVTKEWDAMAGEWDDLATGYATGFIPLLWQETGYAADDPTSRQDLIVLDFGCATGLVTERIRHHVARVIAIDVAPNMMDALQDKLRAGEWKNVDAYCGAVAHLETTNAETKAALQALQGKVDIVAASSVLNFVPDDDMEATMRFLAGLLKPTTGVLFHTDWPKGAQHPNGFTEEKAMDVYQKGGLTAKTTKLASMKMGSQNLEVFLGVATKPL